MICESCNQEREFLEEGICFICKRIETGTTIVQKNRISDSHGKIVKSVTGKKDENMYLRG